MIEIPKADWICAIGVSEDFYQRLRSWLEGGTQRRLVFIDIDGKGGSFDHLQVKVYSAPTEDALIEWAKKIGWKAAFQSVAVVDLVNEESGASQFEKVLLEHKEAAHLLISDWADGGESVLKHAMSHWNSIPDVRLALELKDRFSGIPAIICGGGPSLQKNAHLLDREKALIFAGGAALNQIPVEPHFAASIDREAPFDQFKRHTYWQAPFFYMSRMNPENFSLLHGEKFYVPDGCYPAECWLTGQELFDGGWTVGTFMTAIALLLGCDPIIYVGMDLCYDNGQKYACLEGSEDQTHLVEAIDSNGKKVWTQRDWMMARTWFSDLAARRWDRSFINATEGGLGFSAKIEEKTLQEALDDCKVPVDLAGRVHSEIIALDWMEIPIGRMDEWKKSLKRCLKLCKRSLKKLDLAKWEVEIAYQKLLFPLWQIWRPIFERELDIDLQPIPFEEKLRINQILFFEQVLHEQTN